MLDVARIRAISLDLDDTLWPIWPAIQAAEKALAHWLGDHAPMTSALFANPAARHDVRQQVLREHPELAHDLASIRRLAIRRSLELAGEPPELAVPAFDVFYAARNQVTLYDDALPAPQWLASRYPLVALTNGNADLNRIGLTPFFKACITATGLGVGKPDVRAYTAAAMAAGVPIDQVLHVGDDVQLDVLGAMAAGMQAVWVNRTDQLWANDAQLPHEEIDTLTELCNLLGGRTVDASTGSLTGSSTGSCA